jgi:hypothetical protein
MTALAAYLCVAASFAEPLPEITWARKAGSGESEQGRAIATDASGNIYVTGFFSETTSFGTTNLVSSGTEDVFVAKYNPAGTLLWARRAGGNEYDEGRGIAVDSGGNVYVTGLFQNNATFAPTNLNSSGGSDVFIAKYDTQGTLLWARKAGGDLFDEAYALALDKAGNVYITGSFEETAMFGSTTLTNTSGSLDVFVAKCDSNGAFLWARRAGGVFDDGGNGIAVDAATNVYVTGFFATNAAFGSTNMTAPGMAADIFVVKYNSSGTLQWVRQAGGPNQDAGQAVAVDSNGHILVTGQFRVSASFGTTNITGNGADIFVARYDPAGNVTWVRRAGGNDPIYGDQGWAVQADAAGNAYVSGHFSGTANFGTTNITTLAFNDAFVAKYSTNGQMIWVERIGGIGIDIGCALALDMSNNVSVTGFFYDTATAGTTNLTSSGLDDFFVAKLASVQPPRLNIARTGNSIVLSWPLIPAGFGLESAIATPTNVWSAVSPPPVTNGIWNVVTQSVSGPQRFFRLRAP